MNIILLNFANVLVDKLSRYFRDNYLHTGQEGKEDFVFDFKNLNPLKRSLVCRLTFCVEPSSKCFLFSNRSQEEPFFFFKTSQNPLESLNHLNE